MRTRIAVMTAATLTALAVVVAVASLGGGARPAHAGGGGCPADYAAGFYGFNGQSISGGAGLPVSSIATAGAIFLTSDGTGLLTGTVSGYETVNAHGATTRTNFTGTFAMVLGECIGSATVTPTTGPATHWDLVPVGWSLGGHATQVLFVQTDPHQAGTLTAISM